jgi:plastocyanin
MKNRFALLVYVLVLTLIVAGCSPKATTVSTQPSASSTNNNFSTEISSTPVQPSTGSTVEISIADFSFSPKDVTIKVGTMVTWTNQDSAVHTVTSDTDLFESGSLTKGISYSYTFSTAGTFAYHCTPHHANMTATIVVTD